MAATTHAFPLARLSLLEKVLSFRVLLAAAMMLCVYLMVWNTLGDPDIWWHLRDAHDQIQAHAFLRRDLYSFTVRGGAWINHEWLAELPFYLGWKMLGERGLFVITVAAVEIIFLGVYRLAWRESGSEKAALLVSFVGALLATVSFGPRTLLFGWIGLVAELLLLQAFIQARSRVQRHIVWMMPALFALWVNTHGSWLIGMVVLLTCLVSGCVSLHWGAIESEPWSREQRRILAQAGALSVAALFANPYGWRLVAYPFDLAFRQKLNIANVEEWQTLDFHTPRAHFLLVSLCLLFVAQLVQNRKWTLYELALLAIGVYASFTYMRFLFLAAILIFPLMARSLPRMSPYRRDRDKPLLNAAALCLLLAIAAFHFPSRSRTLLSEQSFPVRALPMLKTFHPQGNVFNEFLWGGYLEWNAPQIPVLIDSRVDIFEYRGVLKDYLDATRLQNTLEILDRYKIRYVLFEQHSPLVYLLQQTHQWKVDYQDGTTMLLERSQPLFQPPTSMSSGHE